MNGNVINNEIKLKLMSRFYSAFVCLLFISSTLVLMLAGTSSLADTSTKSEPIRFGLLPFLTKATLVRKFDPLLEYLERHTGRSVVIRSAPDFRTYIERAVKGEYDIFLAAPHISAYMEREHKAHRLAGFSRPLNGYFVVRKDAPYKTLADLKGKRFAFADSLAVITLLGEQSLIKQGMDPQHDIHRHYSTHNNAMRLVSTTREQDVAVVGAIIFDNTPEIIKSNLRILASTDVIPSMMFYAHRSLDKQEADKLARAMQAFTKDGAGKAFFERTAYQDMVVITDDSIEKLSLMVDLLKSKLEKP